MPEISRFYGIAIRMYYDEHAPPHFHAIYAESEGQIGIDPIQVLSGNLPVRVVSMVVEWAALHQHALKENGDKLRADKATKKIAPFR